jgi:hypothetical protein
MHVIVSWNIKSPSSRWAEIDNAMKEGISAYSRIQPLPSFFIIETPSVHDWDSIQNALLLVADKYSGEVNFLLSPLYEAATDYFVYAIPDEDFYQNQ